MSAGFPVRASGCIFVSYRPLNTMKNVIAIVLALVIGYFLLGAMWWLMFKVFEVTWELTKLIMVLVIAFPVYVIIRKKVFR